MTDTKPTIAIHASIKPNRTSKGIISSTDAHESYSSSSSIELIQLLVANLDRVPLPALVLQKSDEANRDNSQNDDIAYVASVPATSARNPPRLKEKTYQE